LYSALSSGLRLALRASEKRASKKKVKARKAVATEEWKDAKKRKR
jgi:hypothetical protein